MDSNASNYHLNHAKLPQVYYQGKEADNIIDLGLSLRVLQPESYHPSPHADDFDVLIDWHQLHPRMKNSKTDYPQNMVGNHDDETEGIQSKERWSYVKVNMDGVIVGRKICILDHMGYSDLALQLEEMFGKQSVYGLRLFQSNSEYSLLYRGRDEHWRTVDEVPWNNFVESVKRLRIVRKDEAFSPSSSALLNSL
ncbi:auxin-responsive protein IAA32-like [Coffea arabica]|uniref:Auxin-responsive protein n=1 Tax=Coffea arabica TaxID=13443 RepID=A0A6P6V3R1_COFAR